jgi:hypothetical protein
VYGLLGRREVLLSCIVSVSFILRKGRFVELYRDCKVYCEEGKSN